MPYSRSLYGVARASVQHDSAGLSYQFTCELQYRLQLAENDTYLVVTQLATGHTSPTCHVQAADIPNM
jgi:hypothetical protein